MIGDAVFKDSRKAAYLNDEGADRPLESPVSPEVLERARAYRLQRLRDRCVAEDCAALLLYDPCNIRYAFDCSNMQVWCLHNPIRYALIFADGPAIMFEFKGCMKQSENLAGIDELRTARTWMYMALGDKSGVARAIWADEIADLVRIHGGGNRRIACDRLDGAGTHALVERGLHYVDGARISEIARSIKSEDEIELMRWTMRVCEAGMARIYDHSVPGVTERELWAQLHFENARSGGDWLETKLLTAGPRTNPWYQECSDRICQAGEMISFDTDMIGPYGYCADVSRSWTCGYMPMTAQQRRLYETAFDQVQHNTGILYPGMDFAEFNEKSWKIPERHAPYRYSVAVHGVGMADEWPVLPLHVDWSDLAMSGHFEHGMVICVESLVAEAGSESIKLESQVLVTETGCERLDSFPYETR